MRHFKLLDMAREYVSVNKGAAQRFTAQVVFLR